MHTIVLYFTPGSAPCRSVLLTGAALNLTFDLQELILRTKFPDVIKEINPTKLLVPTIKDGDFALYESRAIITYLAEKYDKRVEFNLYPNVPEIRAIINQVLNFDVGTLYTALANYYYPLIFGIGDLDPIKYKHIEEAFAVLDTILKSRDKLGEENLYAAADWLTIADLSLAASVSTFIVCGFHIEKYKFVGKWYNTVQKMPNFDHGNTFPLRHFKELFDEAIKARNQV